MKDMDEQIRKEKDFVILKSIAKHGYSVMPQDFAFLTRYSLMNIYIEIIKNLTSDRPTIHLERACKAQAEAFALLPDRDLSGLRTYRQNHGDQKTKELLGAPLYWKMLLTLLRKGRPS